MKKLLLILLFFAGQVSAAFTYEGTFTTPNASTELHSLNLSNAITYDVNCFGGVDPSPSDGQPGCLGMLGNWGGNQGLIPVIMSTFDIVPPVILPEVSRIVSQSAIQALPQGQVVLPRFDPTTRGDGTSIFQEIRDNAFQYLNRWMPGVTMLPDGRLLTTCASDYYNVGRTDFPSLCMATLENGVATAYGPYDVTTTADSGILKLGHVMQVSEYLTVIPQSWADTNLAAAGETWCIAGLQRTPGSSNIIESQGPGMTAVPCGSMTNPTGGTLVGVPLVFYRVDDTRAGINIGNPEAFPDKYTDYSYDIKVKSKDISWGSHNGVEGVFVSVERLGGDIWWYGLVQPDTSVHAHRNSCYVNTIAHPTGDVCSRDARDWDLDYIVPGGIGVAVGSISWPGGCGVSCQVEFDSFGPDIPPGYSDPCISSKGYHAAGEFPPYYTGGVVFYPATGLATSAAASLAATGENDWDHLSDPPYELVTELTDFAELWSDECISVKGVSYDQDTGRVFVIENAVARQIIHVWSTSGAVAPVLATPTGTSTGTTTAIGSIFTDRNIGTLYSLVSENASELTATIKAGDSQAVSVIGTQNVSATGLTDATDYYYHFIHNTVDGDSNIAVSPLFTTGGTDVTDPIAGNVTVVAPTTGSEDSSITVTWGASSDETALDTVVLEYSVDDGGAPGNWFYRANVSSAGGSTDITALPPSFAIWFRVRATDTSGNTNTGAELNSATLPLQTAPDLTMKSSPSGDLELPDTDPDAPFGFITQGSAPADTLITSNPITVTGVDSFAEAPITVLIPEELVIGSEYRINGGAWTAIPGTVTLNDTVEVRHVSHPTTGEDVDTYLTIGDTQDLFTTTTAP